MQNDIKKRRLERGLSQAELASALGVSRQTINSIETGRYLPSLPLAMAHRASEAPGAQLAAWAAAWYPPRDVALFGGRSMRFVRHLAPSLTMRERTWLFAMTISS